MPELVEGKISALRQAISMLHGMLIDGRGEYVVWVGRGGEADFPPFLMVGDLLKIFLGEKC